MSLMQAEQTKTWMPPKNTSEQRLQQQTMKVNTKYVINDKAKDKKKTTNNISKKYKKIKMWKTKSYLILEKYNINNNEIDITIKNY